MISDIEVQQELGDRETLQGRALFFGDKMIFKLFELINFRFILLFYYFFTKKKKSKKKAYLKGLFRGLIKIRVVSLLPFLTLLYKMYKWMPW